MGITNPFGRIAEKIFWVHGSPKQPLLGSHFQCLRLRGLSWTESRVIILKRFSTKSSFPSMSRLMCRRYIFSFQFAVHLKCRLVLFSVILLLFEPLTALFCLSFQLANVLEIDLGLVKVRILQGWKWKAIYLECLIWNDAFITDWEGGESRMHRCWNCWKKKKYRKAIFQILWPFDGLWNESFFKCMMQTEENEDWTIVFTHFLCSCV